MIRIKLGVDCFDGEFVFDDEFQLEFTVADDEEFYIETVDMKINGYWTGLPIELKDSTIEKLTPFIKILVEKQNEELKIEQQIGTGDDG